MSIKNANVTGNIAILGLDGKYLKVTPSNGLEFGNQHLDDQARFKVKEVLLTGNNGKFVNMYYINDVKCEGADGGLELSIVYLVDGMVNLTISGYQGQDGRTAFLSSDAGNKEYNGSLAVKGIEDRTCRFTVQNL
ncbi:hypothetical protein B0H11DRAFT_1736408 [Mycena galericulata]|nr:hypothetical protein B0H11DRAFT_1736408 [Mycena galericulata]